jgi:hypothetical protein
MTSFASFRGDPRLTNALAPDEILGASDAPSPKEMEAAESKIMI